MVARKHGDSFKAAFYLLSQLQAMTRLSRDDLKQSITEPFFERKKSLRAACHLMARENACTIN